MTVFQQSLSRFTWLSHIELVYIHFSLYSPPLYVCPFCWTIKSASLFSSVHWESMFGQRCCSLSGQWFPASRTSSWDQTRTTSGSLDFTAPTKEKWTGFNLVVNLTFRAERIIIHETGRYHKWLTRMTRRYLDGYLVCMCLNNDREWRKSPDEKKSNRSVSKETNASSQAVEPKGFFLVGTKSVRARNTRNTSEDQTNSQF